MATSAQDGSVSQFVVSPGAVAQAIGGGAAQAGMPPAEAAAGGGPGQAGSPGTSISLVVPVATIANVFGAARPAVAASASGAGGLVALERGLEATLPGSPLYEDAQVKACFAAWKQLTDAFVGDRALVARLRAQLKAVLARAKTEQQDCRRAASAFKAAAHVAAKGDAGMLEVAGIATSKSTAHANAAMGAPPAFAARPGAHPGTVVLDWGAARGAHGFVAQHSFDGVTPTLWAEVNGKIKRRMTVKGMPTGQHMSFRIAALGAAGEQGPWSAAVSVLIG